MKDQRKNLDDLTRSDDGNLAQPHRNSNFEFRRQKVRGICISLQKPCEKYLAQKTVDSIEAYIKAGNRIIYSEITNIVYNMSPEEQGTFNTNLESLMTFVLSKDSAVSVDVQDSVIRLWDHVHLAMRQVGNAKEILEKSTAETKEKLYNELYSEFKGIEKEYITILGIFASIIISFVAGITFSTSVLENMHSVSIYRLALVILLIAFVLLNCINLLIRYIFRLNKADDIKFPIWQLNLILAVLLGLVFISWAFSIDKLPLYIKDAFNLPWTTK